mmetsp:Transcript_31099/g.68739  ORF Transcript_31099/g.68739 Transcript_31099/m.68739 type:complete len:87 (+) Transcript_31099:18-278(+)
MGDAGRFFHQAQLPCTEADAVRRRFSTASMRAPIGPTFALLFSCFSLIGASQVCAACVDCMLDSCPHLDSMQSRSLIQGDEVTPLN